MKSEKLLVQYLSLIVYQNPEWFALTVPAVTPLELGNKPDLDLKDRPGDWLALNVDVEVRNVASEFEQLVLHVGGQVPLRLLEILLADHV